MNSYTVFFSDHHPLPLPEGHRFPEQKYRMLRNYLLNERIISETQLRASPVASEELLMLAHSPQYVESFKNGSVDPGIIKRIGLPWSFDLYVRSAATVGGAVAATEEAVKFGISGCLAGGTHHAHFDRGEGYCVFNDIAVASIHLMKKKRDLKIAVIDLDVHQGNGNSSILARYQNVFVVSVHGEKNYPFKKIPSSLDIGLPEGAGDEEFLKAVGSAMTEVKKFSPDYVFYQMGVDPLKEDKLGKMNVSFEGLMQRDRMVLKYCRENKIPISLALGGGYADPIELSVQAYANTYRVVNELY